MNLRQILIAAGVGLFGLSVLEFLQPGAVPLPDSDILLTGLGGLALLYTLSVALNRRRQGLDRVETPDVELTRAPDVPGTDLAETLEGFPGTGITDGDESRSVRHELGEVAAAVLTGYKGVDPDEASKQVAAGTWTDDETAASFLAEDELTVSQRIRALFGRYQRHAKNRTVTAIAGLTGVETGEDGDESDDEVTLHDEIDETGTVGRTRGVDDRSPKTERQTHHWTGVSAVVLLCVGLGLLLSKQAVLLAGVVAVGYAAYARATPQGTVELSASRSLSDTDPEPGDELSVTVTVTNNGGFCPDLRLVDGVPGSLAVTDGSPRRAATLRAGESVTFSYSVTARPGTHEFGPVLAVARNLANSGEQELLVDAATTITAVPAPRPVRESIPLRQQPTQYAGRAPTDTGGEGVEFHTVREYHPGDSMSRIDWNRRARTGELTTVEFRRERATRVVLIVDVRPEAYVGHSPGAANAVERSIDAAQRLFPTLLDEGHLVGIGTFGTAETFLPPDTGTSHRQRGRDLLATDPVLNADVESDSHERYWLSRLRQQLSANTQLLVFSPVVDARVVRILRRLEAYDYPTTVISPDPTTTATPSCRLMRARRRLLLTELRQTGIPVFDWAPETPIEEILKQEARTV